MRMIEIYRQLVAHRSVLSSIYLCAKVIKIIES